MSILSWLGGLFDPVSKVVDDLHFSGEEKAQAEARKAELRNKLAEIESRVSMRLMELQSQALDMQTKLGVAEQQHGNWLSKGWRPVASLAFVALLCAMGLDVIEFKPLLAQVAGAFLGLYGIGRTVEKKK